MISFLLKVLIFVLLTPCYGYAFGIDMYSSPTLISLGEIYLLSNTTETTFYQPAKNIEGFSICHSNPHGFSELNVIQLASQFLILKELFAAGTHILDNEYISDKVFYIGYSKLFSNISLGTNLRYYNQQIKGYKHLDAVTLNLGLIWHNEILTHGMTYSNISHSTSKGISLPTTLKYECMITPIEKTNFGVSFEKEKNFEMRYAFSVSRQLLNMFSVNTGFINNPNQFSAGVIISIQRFDVSLGMRTHRELGYTKAIGILYKP